MEAAFFNIEGGYLEGIARGFKSGILTSSNYVNLSQCENLEGNQSGKEGPSFHPRTLSSQQSSSNHLLTLSFSLS
jgi:hypothetical protein